MDESPKQLIGKTETPILMKSGNEKIATQYTEAEKITLIMDNLETHKPKYLYEAFPTAKAKVIWDKF